MGCPLAALAFTFALHTSLQQIHQRVRQLDPAARIFAYMDDFYIMAHHQQAHRAMGHATDALRTIGLHLNQDKTTIWLHSQLHTGGDTFQGIKRVPRPVVLQNTADPIVAFWDSHSGGNTLTDNNADETTKAVQRRRDLAERIVHLQKHNLPYHTAQALWRTATAGDATFLARTAGIDDHTATALDNITTTLWRIWLHVDTLPDHVTQRIWQPLSEGGLGFTAAKHLQHAALIASWKQTLPGLLATLELQDGRTLFMHTPRLTAMVKHAADQLAAQLWDELTHVQPSAPVPRLQQKRLAAMVRTQDRNRLTSTLPVETMAVMHSAGGVAGGAWMATPVEGEVPLTNDQFTAATRLRLHMPQHTLTMLTRNANGTHKADHATTPSRPHCTTYSHANTDRTWSDDTTLSRTPGRTSLLTSPDNSHRTNRK